MASQKVNVREMIRMLKEYLAKVSDIYKQPGVTEGSYYSALESLVRGAIDYFKFSGLEVVSHPSPTDAGAPDFRVWDGRNVVVGYIEAKKPSPSSLAEAEASEQVARYLKAFPNFILTDFITFIFYRDGMEVDRVSVCSYPLLEGAPPQPQNVGKFFRLLYNFLSYRMPAPTNAEKLANFLAVRAHQLRESILHTMKYGASSEKETLEGIYKTLKEALISTLTEEEFADMYAQTIVYGLLVARLKAKGNFTRKNAFQYIPSTLLVIKQLFFSLSWGLPGDVCWVVDDIVSLLAQTNVKSILKNYYKQKMGGDPIVHFYETFLAAYDPEERKHRGVYYTPEPVVSYIVRSVNYLLKKKFGLRQGLASKEVTLLDPAAGTMSFVAEAVRQAVKEWRGAPQDIIRDRILPNFYAFEIMVAPYIIGHLKMTLMLKEEFGYDLRTDERVQLYLTNTLDLGTINPKMAGLLPALADESEKAFRVKKTQKILVVLGNPPYSGHSLNKGEFITTLMEDYKKVDGKPLGEKNPKWLQDDYVKFIRFAQWKIEQNGRGVIGFITNHAYLDNPTFRGMRRHLMKTFDEIYILNLHGNVRKQERSPDGSKDENVFDIQQGVAIAFFVKLGERAEGEAKVYYVDLWGSREEKYDWLSNNDFSTTKWQDIKPEPEFYFFVPRDTSLAKHYNTFLKVTDIFLIYSAGIVTARDRLTIHWTRNDVWNTVLNFSTMAPQRARRAYQLGKDAQDWKVIWAQQDLRDSGPSQNKIAPILYRPFDVRYTYYTGRSRGFLCRPRPEVMQHMLAGKNVALVFVRQIKASHSWQHCFVSSLIVESCLLSNHTSEISYVAPLYLYPNKRTNLNPKLLEELAKAYGEKPTPEQVFYYIYAVLYAPTYREKYSEFLCYDFPRIPFPSRKDVFERMASLGRQLVDLHLLHASAISQVSEPRVFIEGEGDLVVKHVRYCEEDEKVYINESQYFERVPKEVWEYHIGGYQVCEKWLKDRKGKRLTADEIETYCDIVKALARTIELQQEIDKIYPEVEKSLLDLNGVTEVNPSVFARQATEAL